MKNETLQAIIDNNARFVEDHDQAYFQGHMSAQHPRVTMVGCCDSRCQAHVIEVDPIDRVFTVETIGNQMASAQGSVDYGVLHLHTPILLILGHTDCGAIKAFMKGYDRENEAIKRELDFLKPPLKTQVDPHADFEKELLKNVQKNVDYQVQTALERYRAQISEGRLMVVGAIYDFTNALGNGYGRVSITNVNGVKDLKAIRELVQGVNLERSLARVNLD
ncbi:MAG TPA: carbonic anhydrase [Deltaproteobacteria bacterium]|nr:carbonic anhydrase [Deltaproteobacteria bacterium]